MASSIYDKKELRENQVLLKFIPFKCLLVMPYIIVPCLYAVDFRLIADFLPIIFIKG